MIPSRRGNHAGQIGVSLKRLVDLVKSATAFERKYRLQVFAFGPDLVVKASRDTTQMIQRCFAGDVIDACSQYFFEKFTLLHKRVFESGCKLSGIACIETPRLS